MITVLTAVIRVCADWPDLPSDLSGLFLDRTHWRRRRRAANGFSETKTENDTDTRLRHDNPCSIRTGETKRDRPHKTKYCPVIQFPLTQPDLLVRILYVRWTSQRGPLNIRHAESTVSFPVSRTRRRASSIRGSTRGGSNRSGVYSFFFYHGDGGFTAETCVTSKRNTHIIGGGGGGGAGFGLKVVQPDRPRRREKRPRISVGQ